ncbi:uncharacterized protein DNG_05797 [Cephalotrichum gorgonifer]|uniref:Uncharacterized protein n=1 Tax=Cephalotrichum gorgonifer TaxID=2041049 RepID=A0AAE8N1F4_9PEZI|nr:uncharacterized protein DNG_05797 [Cephalotrichum gorgonifer]
MRGTQLVRPTAADRRRRNRQDGAHPLDRIGPGEVERTVGGFYDWSRDWDLVLSTNNESRALRDGSSTGDEWRTYAQLYFNDLSDLGSDAVPWNDAARTQRLVADVLPRSDAKKGWLKFTWKFCERSENPRWGARFIIYYKGRGALVGVDGSGPIAGIERPWRFFDTKDCVMAEMDRRTGSGRYKKVMWYNSKHGYGNNVLHEPVEARKSAHNARYADFVRGLLPRFP